MPGEIRGSRGSRGAREVPPTPSCSVAWRQWAEAVLTPALPAGCPHALWSEGASTPQPPGGEAGGLP